MPSETPSTIADQLSVAYLTRHAEQARQIIQEAARRFPELKFEEIQIDGANEGAPSGAAVMLLFDHRYAQNQTAMQWLTKWSTARGWIPILPVALDPQSLVPPAPLDGIKSRVWPQDKDQLLTTTGACLGMAIRPGRSKLFISYRKSDAFKAAEQLRATWRMPATTCSSTKPTTVSTFLTSRLAKTCKAESPKSCKQPT